MTRRLDVDFVREQFPAFTHPRTGDWAHLENAGGSYVPVQVIEPLVDLFSHHKVQPGWDFAASQAASAEMARAREVMAATFNAEPDHIHFGPSTSQNTYVLAQAMRPLWTEGDEIVVTQQDHEANSGVWRRLATTGITVREWTVDPETGLLDEAELDELIGDRTRLVAMTHASNIAATINPVASVAARVHAVGGHLVVDGVSYAPHALPDVDALGCDVYLYSAYKTFGPHTGMMYTAPGLLATVSHQGHFFNEPNPLTRLTPAGPDHAVIGATAGVVDYHEAVHAHHWGEATGAAADGDRGRDDRVGRLRRVFELYATHEESLIAPLLDFLARRDDVRIVGRPEPDCTVRCPTVAFHTPRRSSAEIYRALIEAKVACGHGHFYAHRLVDAIGLDPDDGVVRLSAVHYNTDVDISRALETLDRVL